MVTIQCPQCGGQLDPAAARGGVSRCPYCGTASLMSEGQQRTLTSHALQATHQAAEFRDALIERMHENGFEEIPEIEITETSVPFLVRRGHVRITPKPRQGGNEELVKRHEEVHEGYFGVPLSDEFPVGIFQAKDTSAFVEGPEQFPDDLEGALLRFDDQARAGLVKAWKARTEAAHISFVNWDDRATWTDELYTLTVPVAVLSFQYPTRNNWRWEWERVSPDGCYTAAYNLHDGAELRAEIPNRHRNLLVAIVVIFLAAFLGVPLLIGAIAGIIALAGVIFATAG